MLNSRRDIEKIYGNIINFPAEKMITEYKC